MLNVINDHDYKIKDIISIVILFEHLEYLNNGELLEDWGSDDVNGNEWIKIKLIQIIGKNFSSIMTGRPPL